FTLHKSQVLSIEFKNSKDPKQIKLNMFISFDFLAEEVEHRPNDIEREFIADQRNLSVRGGVNTLADKVVIIEGNTVNEGLIIGSLGKGFLRGFSGNVNVQLQRTEGERSVQRVNEDPFSSANSPGAIGVREFD